MTYKRYFLALSMTAATLFAFSCAKEADQPAPAAKEGTVRFTAQAPEVKTTIEDGSGSTRIVKWAVDDVIDIIWAEGATTSKAQTAGTSTTFDAEVDPANIYYALYPAGCGSVSEDVVTISVPTIQTGAFAAANIAVAKTDGASRNLAFSNATALVKFSVGSAGFSKAVFTATNGEAIAGDAAIDFSSSPIGIGAATNAASAIEVPLNGAGEYYFAALPAGELTGGFSVTLYKGETADKTVFVRSASLSRAKIMALGTLDDVVVITNIFVTPEGKGNKSGKSWDNAMGAAELADFLAQPVDGEGNQVDELALAKALILDGVTIHMAAGEYYLAKDAVEYVKVAFTGYPTQVAINFKGGYPADKTGTDVSWTMPTAGEEAPANCTILSGNKEKGILRFGDQTNISFEGITIKDAKFPGSEDNAAVYCAADDGNCSVVFNACRVIDNENTDAKSAAGIMLVKAEGTIENCYFSGNYARNGSCVNLNAAAGDVTITNCVFTGNQTFNTSGALQNGGKNLTVTNCVFTNNTAGSYGGGAFHSNGNGAVSNFTECSFEGNSASKGGAVSLQNATATFTKCSFKNNSATEGSKKEAGDGDSDVQKAFAGGAIILHHANSVCTLNNCSFEGNTAPNGNGGAIAYEEAAATLNINAGTSFTNCSSYGPGGAIFVRKGSLNIAGTAESKVKFIGCKTLATGNQHGNGGAIWLANNTSTSIEHALFDNCEAGQEDGSTVNYSNGGSIRAMGVTSLQVSNAEFKGNRGRNGMCLSLELAGNSLCKFTDCNFHDNIGRSGASKNGTGGNFHGGVAQLGYGTVQFERCAFTDNVAYHGSGAVHQNGANTLLKCKDCTFTHNTAINGNGGCVTVELEGSVELDACTFTNNNVTASSTTRRDGGVFYFSVAGSSLKAEGCTFKGNSIIGAGDKNPYGGVIRAGGNSDFSFTDCVFDGNGSTIVYSGACFSLNQDTVLKMDGCLFKNNFCRSRGACIQGGTASLVYLNNVSFYNNYTTAGGGWGVNTHFGNANLCMNNVTSINNHSTNANPGNCASFNGDGGFLVVNSTIIDATPTAVVRRGGSNGRKAIFCNDVLINTADANNTWAMNQATNFSSKGHNVVSTDGTYNNAAPDTNDLLGQTSLPSGAYSEHWTETPHYATYTWNNSLSGFSAAKQADVIAAIEAYTETDTVHTSIKSIGADFKAWLESLDPTGYSVDSRNVARAGTWWPGSYQN